MHSRQCSSRGRSSSGKKRCVQYAARQRSILATHPVRSLATPSKQARVIHDATAGGSRACCSLALDHELAAQAVEHDGAEALGAPHRLLQVEQRGAVVLNGRPLQQQNLLGGLSGRGTWAAAIWAHQQQRAQGEHMNTLACADAAAARGGSDPRRYNLRLNGAAPAQAPAAQPTTALHKPAAV